MSKHVFHPKSGDSRDLAAAKRRLRRMKRWELAIRFGGSPPPPGAFLLWDRYFNTRQVQSNGARYPLAYLLQANREEWERITALFFAAVYHQHYREQGTPLAELYDPALLDRLSLPPGATTADVKSRFRELAKVHHPDHGGDSARFRELYKAYRALLGGGD